MLRRCAIIVLVAILLRVATGVVTWKFSAISKSLAYQAAGLKLEDTSLSPVSDSSKNVTTVDRIPGKQEFTRYPANGKVIDLATDKLIPVDPVRRQAQEDAEFYRSIAVNAKDVGGWIPGLAILGILMAIAMSRPQPDVPIKSPAVTINEPDPPKT